MKKLLYCFLIFLSSLLPLSLQGEEKPKIKPVVIIGSGVGALTSAVYLQRAGIPTVVIEGPNPGGAIAQSPSVQNWPGETEIHGQDLIEKIRKQAEANGATFLSKEVVSIDIQHRPFTFTLKDVYDGNKIDTIQAQACIIAMGSVPKLLGIPGESGQDGYWTRGVYSCAICDGGLYRGKTVAVIGGGDSAILEADYLSKLAKKVYIVLRSDKFRTVETLRKEALLKKGNVEVIYNAKVEQIAGNGAKVTHLNLSTEKELPIDGVFVAIGAEPNSQLVQKQLKLDSHGYILVNQGMETSIPGVFAIGDVVDPIYKQAISAAGDGAKAALQAERYLTTASAIEALPSPLPSQNIANMEQQSVIESISDPQQLYQAIGKDGKPLLVEFYSPVCGPCQKLAPKLEQSAHTHQGKIRFLKVDVTKFSNLADAYNVFGVPSVLFFDAQGKVIKQASGYEDISTMLQNLDSSSAK